MTKEICGETEAACVCIRPPGHLGFHRCQPSCSGEWRRVGDRFLIGAHPIPNPLDPMAEFWRMRAAYIPLHTQDDLPEELREDAS